MIAWGPASLLIAMAMAVLAGEAAAQPRLQPASGRRVVEVSAGAALGGASPLGSAAADLIRPNGSTLTLFRTDSRFGAGVGGEVSVTGFLSRRFGLEASGSLVRQQVRTRVTDDVERTADVTLSVPISRVLVEGAAIVALVHRPRADVYLRAGGGWMQELADSATLAETGSTATIGVGMKYWWRNPPFGRGTRMGVRLDGRVLARSRGVSFGPGTWQFGPTGTAGVVFGF
jgi:hypothetical protein